jgi:hypothetical protein
MDRGPDWTAHEIVWEYGWYDEMIHWHEVHDAIVTDDGEVAIIDMGQDRVFTVDESGEITWEWQLCDIGYKGYPDPRYRDGGDIYTPDFLAIGQDQDIQHIDVKGFEHLEEHFNNDKEKVSNKINDTISELTKYRNINDEMVRRYLEKRGRDITPRYHEIVVLLPYKVYESYKSVVESSVRSNDLILWIVQTNGESEIWKAVGQHKNEELNNELNSGLRAYPSSNDLIQFTRQTETAIKKYNFIKRLVKYCSRNRTRSFHFDDVDSIMTGNRPRLLYHLPREEREEIWSNYLYSMIHHLELLEHGSGENEYRWKKKRFVGASRDQHQIYSKAKSQLGLDIDQ